MYKLTFFLYAFFLNQVLIGAGPVNDLKRASIGFISDWSEAPEWTVKGYLNAKSRMLNVYDPEDQTVYEKQFDLDIVLVNGTKWTPEIILERYTRVAKIFAKCKVKFKSVRLITTDAPLSLEPPNLPITVFDPGLGSRKSSATFSERTPTGNGRATMFHVSQLVRDKVGVAGAENIVGKTSERLNKQWISEDVLKASYKNERHDNYLTEAHELGHTIMRCDHYDVPGNLMHFNSRKNYAGDALTEEQGKMMRSYPRMEDVDGTKLLDGKRGS